VLLIERSLPSESACRHDRRRQDRLRRQRLRRLEAPLPPISVDWSPVKTYGFYAKPSGVRRALELVDAAAESEEQRNWRETRGEHAFDVIHHHHSPLDDCPL
jgi:hypothetical protein